MLHAIKTSKKIRCCLHLHRESYSTNTVVNPGTFWSGDLVLISGLSFKMYSIFLHGLWFLWHDFGGKRCISITPFECPSN